MVSQDSTFDAYESMIFEAYCFVSSLGNPAVSADTANTDGLPEVALIR